MPSSGKSVKPVPLLGPLFVIDFNPIEVDAVDDVASEKDSEKDKSSKSKLGSKAAVTADDVDAAGADFWDAKADFADEADIVVDFAALANAAVAAFDEAVDWAEDLLLVLE